MRKQLSDFKHLLKNIFRPYWLLGKRSFFYFQYAFDWMRLARDICFYKMKKRNPAVVLCMANPGSIGGTELQIQIIAEALQSRLGECLVLISGKLEGGKSNLFVARLRSLKIPFLQLGTIGLVDYDQNPLLRKGTAYFLGRAIENSKICHFFNPTSTLLASVMKRMGLAIYYMETGMPTLNGWWKILDARMGQFDYVTSVSLAGLRSLESLYGYKGPSCVIPSMFNSPRHHVLARQPLKDVLDIVYFGRMTRNKGVDLLIRSFYQLIKQFPYARLVLIGSGERLGDFKKLVEELHLSDRVQFTDWVQTDQLFSTLIETDLFCLPSYTEGLPCSILEAMSVGLPIVATDVGGVSEIIEDGVSGILIPPRDEEVLTKILLELAAAPVRRLQLGANAFLRWKKVGAKEVIINQLIDAYLLVPLQRP